MRVWVLVVVLLVAASSSPVSADRSRFADSQVYKVSVGEALAGVQAALKELGLNVLGVDEPNGIVVSTGVPVNAVDIKELGKFDNRAEGFYLFVVHVSPGDPGRARVTVSTIVRLRASDRKLTEGGCYLTGNPLSEKLYDRLEDHLGTGLLLPLGG